MWIIQMIGPFAALVLAVVALRLTHQRKRRMEEILAEIKANTAEFYPDAGELEETEDIQPERPLSARDRRKAARDLQKLLRELEK